MRGWYPTHRITNGQPVEEAKKELSRQMRHAPTPSETLAWSLLRGRQILGLKFRRQQVILGFIVDFFCAEEKLVLEIDGSCHDPLAAKVSDDERTAVLAQMDLRVVRIRNEELSKEQLEKVLGDVTGRRTSAGNGSPSPCRERGLGGEVVPERGPEVEAVKSDDPPSQRGDSPTGEPADPRGAAPPARVGRWRWGMR